MVRNSKLYNPRLYGGVDVNVPINEVINYMSEDHRGRRCGVQEGIEYARFHAAQYVGAVWKIIEKKRSL